MTNREAARLREQLAVARRRLRQLGKHYREVKIQLDALKLERTPLRARLDHPEPSRSRMGLTGGNHDRPH